MSTHVTRGSGSRSIGSPVPEEICRPDDLGGSVTETVEIARIRLSVLNEGDPFPIF
jgi:hypothetical protein